MAILNNLENFPYPATGVKISPTSGKQETRTNLCKADINQLQALLSEATSAYDKFKISVIAARKTVSELPEVAGAFITTRINAGESSASRLFKEISDVCDPYQINKVSLANTVVLLDFATVTTDYNTFKEKCNNIATKAGKIKKDNQPEINEVVIGGNSYSSIEIENKSFLKLQFDIKLYAIFPDTSKFNVEQYIQQFSIHTDYDAHPIPIYSVMFMLPESIINDVKDHFENIKWYISVKSFPKTADRNSNEFNVAEIIKDNEELVGIDPEFGAPVNNSATNDTSNISSRLPIYPFKMDFISSRDFQINAQIQSKVFNKCTMFDVISALCAEVRSQYQTKGTDTKDQVAYSISPPDNKTVYEQIMITPGSFTDTLQKLQLHYGVYKSGIRVSFDSHHITTKGKTTKFITVTEKSGIAPSPETITDAVVEIIDMKSTNAIAPEYGYLLDKDSATITFRTCEPYSLKKNNSGRLVQGDNMRVVSSSQNSNQISICDTTAMNDNSSSKIYWSNYDNPYNLTQLQDHVREQNQTVSISLKDVNGFAINDNLKYNLKFYSKDDSIGSGQYRLQRSIFYSVDNKLGFKDKIELQGILYFVNIPELRENGAIVKRPSYSDRVAKSGGTVSGTSQASLSGAKPGTRAKEIAPVVPFKTNFRGKNDYLGNKIPETIPADYKMSEQVKFADVYNGDLYKGQSLSNNFALFVNAQRFSKEVVDSVFSSFGKKGLVSFYESETTSDMGSSQHVLALAIDVQLGGKTGLLLAKNFLQLVDSINSLDLDQLILQGDGSDWKKVHISKNMNETNRNQILIAPSEVSGDYRIINTAALAKLKADPLLLDFTKYGQTI